MKSIKLWQVLHYDGERAANPVFRYAATREVAEKLAAKPLGWYGATGKAAEVELKIYETEEEVG
jgi:hypothetical protein